MRPYEPNSPQAAARIVILSLLADGQFGAEEVAVVERLRIAERVGLTGEDFCMTLQAVLEDLNFSIDFDWGDLRPLERDLIEQLAVEVQDVDLRRKVMNLCHVAVSADKHVSEGEVAFLDFLSTAWASLPDRPVEQYFHGRSEIVDTRSAHARSRIVKGCESS